MRFLVYCIFQSPSQNTPELLPGIAGQPVSLVAANGLTAAVSALAHSHLSPDVPDILAYEKVIESFHRDHTVIPMRYGCLFEQEAQIVGHLEEYSVRYEAMLKELDGLVEMGIRVLLPNVERGDTKETLALESSSTCAPAAGAAYLASQRSRYAERDRLVLQQGVILDKICSRMSGLFVRSRKEFSSSNGGRLFSVYFLVPRISVEAFRKEFQDVSLNEPVRLLLSGPWPPYNFVNSACL